jgi:hypothetical protein
MRLARYGRTFLVAVAEPAPNTANPCHYNIDTSVYSSIIVEYILGITFALVSRCRSIDFLVYK